MTTEYARIRTVSCSLTFRDSVRAPLPRSNAASSQRPPERFNARPLQYFSSLLSDRAISRPASSAADSSSETILYADLDLERARNKRLVRVAGKNEVNRISDRRPELYGPIIAPHQLRRIRDL